MQTLGWFWSSGAVWLLFGALGAAVLADAFRTPVGLQRPPSPVRDVVLVTVATVLAVEDLVDPAAPDLARLGKGAFVLLLGLSLLVLRVRRVREAARARAARAGMVWTGPLDHTGDPAATMPAGIPLAGVPGLPGLDGPGPDGGPGGGERGAPRVAAEGKHRRSSVRAASRVPDVETLLSRPGTPG